MGVYLGRCFWAFVFVAALTGRAQAQGSIAGVVRDSTGAVLPGVSVEATSPALIERVRTAVTDSQGQYKVVHLRPGTYTATFTLPGFTTVRREGIELTAGFTATINIDMKVGDLQEALTVTGSSPIVDVQSVAKRQVVGRQEIEALPTGKNWLDLAAVIPGITRTGTADVGGLSANRGTNISVHDSGAAVVQVAGMNNYNTIGNTAWAINDAAVQEISYTTSGVSVEMPSAGIVANVIPREGGNRFSGTTFFSFANSSMQSDNIDASLKSRGVPAPDRVHRYIDENLGIGGPIRKDRVWFFAAQRSWYAARVLGGSTYMSIDPYAWVYNPDLNRPGIQNPYQGDEQLRLTVQLTPRNKLSMFDSYQQKSVSFAYPGNLSGEANYQQKTPHLYNSQVLWSSPVSNRILVEAASNLYSSEWRNMPEDDADRTLYPVIETNTSRGLVAPSSTAGQGAFGYTSVPHYIFQTRASMTYVTGSHAFKTGMTWVSGRHRQANYSNYDTYLGVLNGAAQRVTVLSTPYTEDTQLKAGLGLYGQDRWTINHLTLDVGVRFDYLNWEINEQAAPGGRWVGPRTFATVPDVPNWKDISPRIGASYDLFGNGRTAVKATVGRYVALEQSVSIMNDINPFRTSVNTATRPWSDTNNDRIPQESELGALSNPNFGKSNITTRYDEDVTKGWGKRPFNWEMTGSVQQQIRDGMSLEAGYYRRTTGNFYATDNLALAPADYEQFCVTAPVDSRLPGGGGNQICGLYDRTLAAFSRAPNNLVTFTDKFGKQTRVYNGIDVSMNARMKNGIFIRGGVNFGSLSTSNCAIVDSPQTRFCNVSPPWLPELNIGGSYRLPWWQISTSAVFQSIPGPQVLANWNAPNNAIVGSLGRNLSACGTATGTCNQTFTVSLIEPGALYGDRRNQLDLRFSKAVSFAGNRQLEVIGDLYNALNANPVITQNNTFGTEWQVPSTVLLARYLKLAVQFKF